MSGHERERLSAYLDGELAPQERALIAAHLEACAECRERLAELAAVDEAAAALPAEAPPDYFESLPGRVRARLEPRPARRSLPGWTWAAAAVLLLAVVTPLTLQRQRHALETADRDALTRPATAPAARAPEAAPATLAQSAAPRSSEAPAGAGDAFLAQGRAKRADAAPAREPEKKLEPGTFAAAPREADARAPLPAAPAPRAAARAEAVPAVPESLREEEQRQAVADTMADAGAAPAAGKSRNQAEAGRPAAAARDELSVAVSSADAVGARAGVAASGVVVAEPRQAPPAEWQRLEAARPRTPAEWRRLREDWRRFETADPDGPRADAARVRVIEAGRMAWRASGDPADERVFRADAAAYLARPEAPQAERVRRLLEPDRP